MSGFITLILLSLSISFFCVGLYVLTQEGMLLYFLRKPYETNYDRLEQIQNRLLASFGINKLEFWRRTMVDFLLTPIIGCVVCYSSFWTIVWHGLYFGLNDWVAIIHVMFIVAFMNAFLVALYHRIDV